MNRQSLLKHLELVKPALSTQEFVPVLKNFCMDGGHLSAYNDAQGIRIDFPIGVDCSAPGELLSRALNSLSVEEVIVTLIDGKELLVSGGRSRLKLPVLPRSDFETIFTFPENKECSRLATTTIEVSPQLVEGISQCFVSVGADPTHPAQMGVTLHLTPRRTTLFSTDNFSASRFQLTGLKHTAATDTHLILPTFFCEQLVRLTGACKEARGTIFVMPGAVQANFGTKAQLFSKLLVDIEPLDFSAVFSKHLKEDITYIQIPEGMGEAFDRALLVLEDADDKVTRVTIEGHKLRLSSETHMGKVHSSLLLQQNMGEADFRINPVLVARACKLTDRLALQDTALLFAGRDNFDHLVTHYAV